MKVLIVGLGNIGLGLLVPTFQEAGYEVVGTDADLDRLNQLQSGYVLKTPKNISKWNINVTKMDLVPHDCDLVVTSVGRKNLNEVAQWLRGKNISAPVILAENLPDQINFFPKQIPIVIDRICPRIEFDGDILTATAEDYRKIVVLDREFTRPLGKLKYVELEMSTAEIELKRRKKMFTVNTAHVVTAINGKIMGYSFIEEAAANRVIASKVRSALLEVADWLAIDQLQIKKMATVIPKRFRSPIRDQISRIIGNPESALRYIEIPLAGILNIARKAPILEEARYNLRLIR